MESREERVQTEGASSAVLLAAAFLIAADCRAPSDAYMRCKREQDGAHPAACQSPAGAVLDCVAAVFARLKSSPCQSAFAAYWSCLDRNNQQFLYCRPEERAFHGCLEQTRDRVKSLWIGKREEEGFRDREAPLPAEDSWPFVWHVFRNKRT